LPCSARPIGTFGLSAIPFGIQVVNRDDELRLAGEIEQVGKAAKVLDQLQRKLRKQDWLTTQEVEQAIGLATGTDNVPASGKIETFGKGPGGSGQDHWAGQVFGRHCRE